MKQRFKCFLSHNSLSRVLLEVAVPFNLSFLLQTFILCGTFSMQWSRTLVFLVIFIDILNIMITTNCFHYCCCCCCYCFEATSGCTQSLFLALSSDITLSGIGGNQMWSQICARQVLKAVYYLLILLYIIINIINFKLI